MPTATYKKLPTEILPQVIETEAQYDLTARRFGNLVGKGRARSAAETRLLRLVGPVGGRLRPSARAPARP